MATFLEYSVAFHYWLKLNLYMYVSFKTKQKKKTRKGKTKNPNSEVYSEPGQTSKMELFEKIINGFHLLTIFEKAPS